VADLLAYFLVITKVAEIVDAIPSPSVVPNAPARPPSNRGLLAPTLPSGEYARSLSFTMRAARANAEPLRIPSPMPGTLRSVPHAAPPPPSSAGSTPRAGGNREAEQALAEAEMHLVLGGREDAVALVRKALALAPGLPAALAFLAYLEALGCGAGQEAYLRDLLRMIDAALVKDEMCKRGRFYRAEIKKRLRDHEGAIRDLRAATRNDLDDVDAHRELTAYERRVRDGSVILRSMSPFEGTPRPVGFLAWVRGKKTPE
jgi:tetratricopeptide (TPR) repeat protein